MNFQRNLIYIALGAAIMFLGMSSARRPDATFDTIECNKLRILDEESKACVVISTNDKGGIIGIYDKDDETSAHSAGLLIGEHGGAIAVTGSHGTIFLRTNDKGGAITIGDKDDSAMVVLRAYEDGGRIYIGGKNKDDIGVNLHGRGTIHTYDKDGNVTSSLPPHPHPHFDTEEE